MLSVLCFKCLDVCVYIKEKAERCVSYINIVLHYFSW